MLLQRQKEILVEFAHEVQHLFGASLKKVILYGSYARGDNRDNSDIDIMILTSLADAQISQIENDVYDLAFEFQMKYDVDISVIVKNENHFIYWLGALPFYDNVQREGVALVG